METRGMKTVYTVIDRGNGKAFWVKLGIGYVNRDGSINIKLDAHPTNGMLQIRDYEPPRAPEPRNHPTAPSSSSRFADSAVSERHEAPAQESLLG